MSCDLLWLSANSIKIILFLFRIDFSKKFAKSVFVERSLAKIWILCNFLFFYPDFLTKWKVKILLTVRFCIFLVLFFSPKVIKIKQYWFKSLKQGFPFTIKSYSFSSISQFQNIRIYWSLQVKSKSP